MPGPARGTAASLHLRTAPGLLAPTRWTCIFFAALIVGGCQPEAPVVLENNVREPDAAIRIKDFRRQSVLTDGRKQWLIEADEAFLYGGQGGIQRQVIVYDFRFQQYGPDGRIQDTVTGERGEIDNEAGRIDIQGEVVFSSADGRTVRGSEITFNRIDQLLTSDEPLIIEDASVVTRCTRGAIIDNANQRQVCRGPVILSTQREGGGSEASFADENPMDLFQ